MPRHDHRAGGAERRIAGRRPARSRYPRRIDAPFEVICEIEPPTRPDLRHVRHQIGVRHPIASAFLIPDNHLGRATVSSVAVAHEVEAMGGRSIACLNCRDRNELGLRRDLLTAAAYGVDQFLCVYGDKPSTGGRTSELTVRTMLDEIRAFGGDLAADGTPRVSASWPGRARSRVEARRRLRVRAGVVLRRRAAGAGATRCAWTGRSTRA